MEERAPPPRLPADHVLGSGGLLSPGVFDQHGVPLIIFPVEAQENLHEISKAEALNFVNYFQRLHKKQEKQNLVSVVADLRGATQGTMRFISEVLLLLEPTIHSAYIIQPRKKDDLKLLLKLLTPSKSHIASFRKILLKEITDLSNYIDRSQLPVSLGGYFMYCHKSWVNFVKEIDSFFQKFLAVVQRLPSCIATLQALSRMQLPSNLSELQNFCCSNEAKFLQLRRELGLDELLIHCEAVVDKLRYPDRDPNYQAMAGTALFTQTAFDMLQNYSRITAAVEKVELLWQQTFSKSHHQLQLLQLREEALQITEKIESLQEKLQSYKVEIAVNSMKATMLLSEFEMSIYTPSMALVRWAEDVIHTLEELLPLNLQTSECWVLDLERLKENLRCAVQFILKTLDGVLKYHQYYSKVNGWYTLALCENFLQELLSSIPKEHDVSSQQHSKALGVSTTSRRRLAIFLKRHPPPDMEELLHLSNLANSVPDEELQRAGRCLSQRCTVLRKLLISSGPVSVDHLQMALQWQYKLLCNNHVSISPDNAVNKTASDSKLCPEELSHTKDESKREADGVLPTSSSPVTSKTSLVEGKLPIICLFDSDFHGTGGTNGETPPELLDGQPNLTASKDAKAGLQQPKLLEDELGVPQCKLQSNTFDLGFVGNVSSHSFQIIPKVEMDSLNLEIKVKRSAAPPNNPWLSLPVDDLENSYTVTITQNATPQKDLCMQKSSEDGLATEQNAQEEFLHCTEPKESPSEDWKVQTPTGLVDPEFTLISNILSSTMADEDKVNSTTDGIPTLLWDSYDLHDEKLEADSLLDTSQDWEVKEQESLRETEKILIRTDGILKEEESVLAQEAVLDALLKTEKDSWSLWHSESSSDLSEAVHLKDKFPGRHDGDHDLQSDSAGEGDTCSDEFFKAVTSSDEEQSLNQEALLKEQTSEPKLCQKGFEVSDSERSLTNWREREQKKEEIDAASAEEHQNIRASVVEPDVVKEEYKTPNHENSCSDGDDSVLTQLNEFQTECTNQLETCEADPGLTHAAGPSQSHEDEQPGNCLNVPNGFYSSDLKEPLADEFAMKLDGIGEKVTGSNLESTLTSKVEPYDESLSSNSDTKTCTTAPLSVTPDNDSSNALLDGVTDVPFVFSQNAKAYSNNNNSNLLVPHKCLSVNYSGKAETCEEEGSAEGLQPEVKALPDEVDPGGSDLSDGLHSSEAVRISGSQRIQLHSDHISKSSVSDFKTPIVLDTGTSLMKAGFADEELPNIVFPSVTGVPKYEEIMSGKLERESYIGHDAQHMRGVLVLKHPIKNGIVHSWDDVRNIWDYTFQQLMVDPGEHPVLLTEAAMNPLENRQRTVEIMFECFDVPFTYVAMQPVLALYGAGRTTGVVFDSGDGVSYSVPVFEGYSLSHSVQRLPLGGRDVTLHLKKLLMDQGVCMRTTAEEEIVREMKEKCCFVALPSESACREMHYSMPDGQIITLGSERFRAPEILFKPELIGRDHYGIHEGIFKSILSADIDLRRCFLQNIILSGGNTLLPGLPERLQAEIRRLSADMGVVGVSSPTDRDFSVWRGGAILANTPTFSSAWIGQDEYEEYGPQIVFRKCF